MTPALTFDDIFKKAKFVAKWLTSGFGIEYTEDENKSYIETLIYKTPLKTFNYTNTGLNIGDKFCMF